MKKSSLKGKLVLFTTCLMLMMMFVILVLLIINSHKNMSDNMVIISDLIASAILLVIGILLTIRFAGKIVDPISEIQKRMDLLAQGDVHSPFVAIKTNDEIGQMSSSVQLTLREISTYIKDLEKGLRHAAEGKLDSKPEVNYVGDFRGLEQSLTITLKNLNTMIQQIMQSADQVAEGAGQVSSGSQILAQGAAEQASSVEELNAMAAEVTQHVNENAQSASEASIKSQKVGDELIRSNAKMEDMLAAMEEINQTSGEIGKIIKTIEEIAFQTNILALNAAVEAARAGEAGKGFSVVADEVRNLAEKSASAANNTTALIRKAVESIHNGMETATGTAKSLELVVEHASGINEMMEKIASASKKQSADLNEITVGLDQISSIVQTNSATSEESAAASEELSGQAELLKSMVNHFQLVREGTV